MKKIGQKGFCVKEGVYFEGLIKNNNEGGGGPAKNKKQKLHQTLGSQEGEEGTEALGGGGKRKS